LKAKKILIIGPKINISNKKSYGGGSGGYTRNMHVYLSYFLFDDIRLIPVYHTIKGELNFGIFTKLFRLIFDLTNLIKKILTNKVDGIHILAQYRGAIIRELFVVLIGRLNGIPILYEIKAGAFIKAYNNNGKLYQLMIDTIIKSSKVVLIEGKIYKDFIFELYNKKAYYFPNVVPIDEIPKYIHHKFQSDILKVLFVGFVYEGKGIKELILGCRIFAEKNNKIELTLVGEIDPEIHMFLENMKLPENFKIYKKGKLNHKDVLVELSKNDIYAYPTKHEGEGHNNTINEALMHGMIVCSTNAGFISDFLNNENSYPIPNLNPEEIGNIFLKIVNDKNLAISKSKKGRELILQEFNSEKAKFNLLKYYQELID